jgi:GNAT superfamily N-acetyltransferase
LDENPRLSIKPAKEGDELELAGDDVSHLRILQERCERMADGRGLLLVAWCDEIAVGHIYLWWEPADEPELRERLKNVPLLMNLWVRKDRREQGIGTALVHEAENQLRARAHRRVALGVELDNRVAIKFYLGRNYYPWPHADLKTHYDEFKADGSHVIGEEVCAVYLKNLGFLHIFRHQLRAVVRRFAKNDDASVLTAEPA